jgi:hypothetical protein
MASLIRSQVTHTRELFLILGIVAALAMICRTDSYAVTLAPGLNLIGASGGAAPIDGGSVVYSVKLARGGPPQNLVSIAIQIDGASSLPLRSVDIDRLRLYFDTNGSGAWDSGIDALIGEQTAVGVGGMTTVPDLAVTPLTAGLGDWFFITISFNASAADRRFSVGAFGPADNIASTAGTLAAFLASGSSVLVWVPDGPIRPVPVGGEWIAGLAFFGCGVYWLLRRRRAVS